MKHRTKVSVVAIILLLVWIGSMVLGSFLLNPERERTEYETIYLEKEIIKETEKPILVPKIEYKTKHVPFIQEVIRNNTRTIVKKIIVDTNNKTIGTCDRIFIKETQITLLDCNGTVYKWKEGQALSLN